MKTLSVARICTCVGTIMIAASVAWARWTGPRERTCSGACSGTVWCDSEVAFCCCKVGNAPYSCVCSPDADCDNFGGMTCTEGNTSTPVP